MRLILALQRIIFHFKTRVLRPKIYTQYLQKEKFLTTSSAEDIGTLNLKQRQLLIQHAYNNSTYYKELIDSCNLNINKFDPEVDFIQIPITTRNNLRANFKSIKSFDSSIKNSYKISTSGTTDKPLLLLHDRRFYMAPLQWRLLNWWGLKPYMNKAFIYRYPRSFFKKIANSLLWWPTSRIFLAGTEMNPATMKSFAIKLNRVKPNLLQGYVDVVYEFALFLMDNDITIYPPKAVWVTAGPLFDYQRNVMEKVFKAPVYNQYGSTEVMMISAECKMQKGLHVMTDTVHVEILDENNNPVEKGEWGKIVLTDLTNYAFPIIRYEIGDYGRMLPFECSCGVNLPLMDRVMVRKAFKITSSLGNELDIEYLSTVFDEYPAAVRFFQFEQQDNNVVFLYYKPEGAKNIDSIIAQVVSNIKSVVSDEFVIIPKKITQVQKVNGKVPFVINNSINVNA